MNKAAFDTLKLARKLRDAGYSAEQAEAIARVQADFIDEFVQTHLSTGQDDSSSRSDPPAVPHDPGDAYSISKEDLHEVRLEVRSLYKQLQQPLAEIRGDIAATSKKVSRNNVIAMTVLLSLFTAIEGVIINSILG